MEELKAPRRPVQKRSRERVRKILDAAEAIIQETGWGSATSHAIAKRAGVPAAGVYHFFPDRFMIYDALVNRYTKDFSQQFPTRIAAANPQAWQDIVTMLIGGIRAYALDNKAARDLSFGCEGEFATRWSSPVRREDLADLMREVYDQHFVLPEIDRIDLKFTLTADFIVTGFLQAVHSGDPMDDDILQEMQEAVIVYMDSWIGSPSKRNQS